MEHRTRGEQGRDWIAGGQWMDREKANVRAMALSSERSWEGEESMEQTGGGSLFSKVALILALIRTRRQAGHLFSVMKPQAT